MEAATPSWLPFSLRTFRLQKTPRTDIYFCLSANIISRYQIQKRGKNKKQFARIAEGWFLGAQIFFAAPYTWFERLVPSQGKATKKSGEYEGMVEHIHNLGYLPQIIHTGTLQFQDIGTLYYKPMLMMKKKNSVNLKVVRRSSLAVGKSPPWWDLGGESHRSHAPSNPWNRSIQERGMIRKYAK